MKRLLLAFDANNQSVVDSPELFASLEPALRADFQLLRRHAISHSSDLPDMPTLLLSGTEDPVVADAAVGMWRDHLAGETTQRALKGGHQFPFQSSLQAVTDLIAEEINALINDHVTS